MSVVCVYSSDSSAPRQGVSAESNRRLLRDAGVFTIMFAGGPGCGKTTLIDRSIELLEPEVRVGVIVCSSGRSSDALKLNHYKEPVVQLQLNGDAYPDPWLFRQALDRLDLNTIRLLLVECIGTLAGRPTDVGQDRTVGIFSVAAGHDKPSKHPATASAVDVIILSKTDLIPFVPFNLARFRDDVQRLNPAAKRFELSADKGHGMAEWLAWLKPPTRAVIAGDASHWFG